MGRLDDGQIRLTWRRAGLFWTWTLEYATPTYVQHIAAGACLRKKTGLKAARIWQRIWLRRYGYLNTWQEPTELG